MFTPVSAGNATLQYQILQGLPDAGKPLQVQNETKLKLNKKTSITIDGYKLNFLLEGKEPQLKLNPASDGK